MLWVGTFCFVSPSLTKGFFSTLIQIQNFEIWQEINFFDKNTCCVITEIEKMPLLVEKSAKKEMANLGI